jgi:hypothetical protein
MELHFARIACLAAVTLISPAAAHSQDLSELPAASLTSTAATSFDAEAQVASVMLLQRASLALAADVGSGLHLPYELYEQPLPEDELFTSVGTHRIGASIGSASPGGMREHGVIEHLGASLAVLTFGIAGELDLHASLRVEF